MLGLVITHFVRLVQDGPSYVSLGHLCQFRSGYIRIGQVSIG
jgi:hypothetical protein